MFYITADRESIYPHCYSDLNKIIEKRRFDEEEKISE